MISESFHFNVPNVMKPKYINTQDYRTEPIPKYLYDTTVQALKLRLSMLFTCGDSRKKKKNQSMDPWLKMHQALKFWNIYI